MSKVSINCQSDLVIDNQFVKDLVPDEYKKFQKLYEKTELENSDAYMLVALSVRDIVIFLDQAHVLPVSKIRPKFTQPVPKELKPLIKALANVQAAAYNKGVYLNVGYEYNQYRTGIRFGLPSDCFKVSFTKRGSQMAKLLKLNISPRLTADVDFG
jgi:hypothetical protein